MSYSFNADEIFEVAEQIERNGVRFYRRAAENTEASQSRQILLRLAADEVEHEKTFADMRADMLKHGQLATVDPVFDPEGEAGLHLRAFADGHIFDTRVDPSEALTGEESIEDILQMALGREKDAVIFYLVLKDMVSKKLGKDKIDQIIREEINHVIIINKELAALNQ